MKIYSMLFALLWETVQQQDIVLLSVNGPRSAYPVKHLANDFQLNTIVNTIRGVGALTHHDRKSD